MRHTTVMHQVSDFGKIEFIIYKQFFYPFDFVGNQEFFNRSALNF